MDYTEHNISVVKLRLKEFAEKEAKKEVLRRMRLIAQNLLNAITSGFDANDEQYPVWTGNLADATGIGIYADGVLSSYIPIKRADRPQENGIGEEVWGTEELTDALSRASSKFSKGLWLVVFSTMDYARRIETKGSPKDRGKGFFTQFIDVAAGDIKDQFGAAIVDVSVDLAWFM